MEYTKEYFTKIHRFIDEYIVEMIPGTNILEVDTSARRSRGRYGKSYYENKIYLDDRRHFFLAKKAEALF